MSNMTRPPADKPRPSQRSRSGCDECRRRHWKCNEAKPTCAFCQTSNRTCVYSRQLSWGGRAFNKSRFRKCLKSRTVAVAIVASNSECCSRSAHQLAGLPLLKFPHRTKILSMLPLAPARGVFQTLKSLRRLFRLSQRMRVLQALMSQLILRMP